MGRIDNPMVVRCGNRDFPNQYGGCLVDSLLLQAVHRDTAIKSRGRRVGNKPLSNISWRMARQPACFCEQNGRNGRSSPGHGQPADYRHRWNGGSIQLCRGRLCPLCHGYPQRVSSQRRKRPEPPSSAQFDVTRRFVFCASRRDHDFRAEPPNRAGVGGNKLPA